MYFDLARELKNWKMLVTVIPIVVGVLGTENELQRIRKRIGRVGNRWKNGDHSDDSLGEISQNTEKIPGDLRKLVVAQIPMKDDQFKLVGKNL